MGHHPLRFSNPGGLGDYSYCFRDNGNHKNDLDPTVAHMDLHIELNWAGAREHTSFRQK